MSRPDIEAIRGRVARAEGVRPGSGVLVDFHALLAHIDALEAALRKRVQGCFIRITLELPVTGRGFSYCHEVSAERKCPACQSALALLDGSGDK